MGKCLTWLAVLTTIVLLVGLTTVLADEIIGITVEEKPNKTNYTVGNVLNRSGLKLKVEYRDNAGLSKTKIIDDDFNCTPEKLDIIGERTITVTYQDVSTEFTVDVGGLEHGQIPIKEIEAEIELFAVNGMPVTGDSSNIEIGDTIEIRCFVLPKEAELVSYVWTYSDERFDNVFEENNTLRLRIKHVGEAKIVVSVKDGNGNEQKSDELVVNIKNNALGLIILGISVLAIGVLAVLHSLYLKKMKKKQLLRQAERERRYSRHDVPTPDIDLVLCKAKNKQMLTTASGIHQGTREYQQDSLYVDDTLTFTDKENALLLGIVCDGMGGMDSGEASSKTAIELFKDEFRRNPEIADIRAFIENTICLANRKVNEITYGNGGTTLITVIIDHNKLYWGSVGDSRIYILRKGEIARLTRDHSYLLTLMEQVARKEISEKEAREHPKKDALISFIGMDKIEIIDISPAPFVLETGDIVLLCSDGLTKTLSDTKIADIVFEHSGDLAETARLLPIETFDKSGGAQDNISVVLIQYEE